MREYRYMALFIDNIYSQSVTRLHQDVQVLSAWVHLNPAGVIIGRGGINAIDQGQFACCCILAVGPDLVRLQVGRVEVGLGWVKNHAVDTGIRFVLVVLDVLGETAIRLNREDIAVSSIFVERVSINSVGGLTGGKNEDGAGVGVVVGGKGCKQSGYRFQ